MKNNLASLMTREFKLTLAERRLTMKCFKIYLILTKRLSYAKKRFDVPTKIRSTWSKWTTGIIYSQISLYM